MSLFKVSDFKYILFVTAIMGLFFCIPESQAHPLDITATELHVSSGNNRIAGYTYIHPFLVGMLLKENNISYNTTDDYYNHKELIVDYLDSRLIFKNNNAVCRISSVNFPPKDKFEIMGGGMEIDYNIDCSVEIGKLDFVNKLFIEYSNLQTNKMVFFKDEEMQTFTKDGEDQTEKIMTAKVTSNFFDFKNTGNNNIKIIDTDKDGLGDDEEKLYGTDLNIIDSDFDGYTDKEEVDNGWYPTDWKVSPGQKERVSVLEAEKQYNEHYGKKTENIPEELIKTSDNQIQENLIVNAVPEKISQPLSEGLGGKSAESGSENKKNEINESGIEGVIITSEEKIDNNKSESAKYFKTGRLQKFLEKIKWLFDKGDVWSLIIIFGLIYILGVLHAFESGHGKSILISYLVEHDKGMKDAFLFSGVMTMTHLADVIILSFIFKIFSVATDIYNYVNDIQKIGACVLLIIGIYYLIKSFIPQKTERWKSYKKAAWLGIIAGLAPCTIGWAIMVIMLSIGKINLIIPVIIFFGLGIWTTLLFFGFVVVKIKNKFIARLKGLTRITSIISALMLVTIAIVLLLK